MGGGGRKAQKAKSGFSVCRKAFGMTWSCPVDMDFNPISSKQRISEVLTERFGPCQYKIARELHKSGKVHFHAKFIFDSEIDSQDPHLFDIDGVHPNILKGKPGIGWDEYLEKEDPECYSNIQSCPYKQALQAKTVSEGMEILALRRPSDYLRFGEAMERNLRRRLQTVPRAIEYFGPYLPSWYPDTWNPDTHSLLLWGSAGINKTQYAKWLMRHKVGEFDYVKGDHEAIKRISGRKPFIFDEINCLGEKCCPSVSREITDVENGGEVKCRNSNMYIPPGLPRIFISNLAFPFRNPEESVYQRRVYSFPLNL